MKIDVDKLTKLSWKQRADLKKTLAIRPDGLEIRNGCVISSSCQRSLHIIKEMVIQFEISCKVIDAAPYSGDQKRYTKFENGNVIEVGFSDIRTATYASIGEKIVLPGTARVRMAYVAPPRSYNIKVYTAKLLDMKIEY